MAASGTIKLYGYWRSSAAYRVRIALAFKGIHYESIPVHLARDGGEQFSDDYRARNPNALVPTLQDGAVVLHQSMAILEYLQESRPEPSLLPADSRERALVRALCQDIACDIHPLNNLRVLRYLTGPLEQSDDDRNTWVRHWIGIGFKALETRLAMTSGNYAFGDFVTMADCCLVPQVYNARRFGVDVAGYPTVSAVNDRLTVLSAFATAAPDQQADAE